MLATLPRPARYSHRPTYQTLVLRFADSAPSTPSLTDTSIALTRGAAYISQPRGVWLQKNVRWVIGDSMNTLQDIRWISAGEFVEAQTRQIEARYKSSHPRPSNKRMGFSGTDKPRLDKIRRVRLYRTE